MLKVASCGLQLTSAYNIPTNIHPKVWIVFTLKVGKDQGLSKIAKRQVSAKC